MIDIKELRRLAQAAIAKMNASDPEFASSTPPLAILELLDRLEAAEKERDQFKSDWLECLTLAEEAKPIIDRQRSEIDALRAKIEAMERQEPAGKFIQHPSNGLWEQDGYGDNPDANPLYALPGAKGE